MLKPQDVVLAAKLLVHEEEEWSQGGLAQELVMSASEVNAGIKRLAFAQIIEKQQDNRRWQVIRPAFSEFLLHGIKYVFPAEKAAPAIGLPTANAAEPLKKHLNTPMTAVWPYRNAKTKGYGFLPLYTTVPQAALNDPELYEWLVIIDALRDGDNDEIETAQLCLQEKLSGRKNKHTQEESFEEAVLDDQQLDLLA